MTHHKTGRLTRSQLQKIQADKRNAKKLRYQEAEDAARARSLLMMALWDKPGWKDEAREFLGLID